MNELDKSHLTNEEVNRLFGVIEDGGPDAAREARWRLGSSVSGLIRRFARHYGTLSDVDPDELFGAGWAGAMEAVARFDRSRGRCFTTVAWHWIRQAVQNEAWAMSPRPPKSRNYFKNRALFDRETERIADERGVPPTPDEVFASLGWLPSRIAAFRSVRDAVCIRLDPKAMESLAVDEEPQMADISARDEVARLMAAAPMTDRQASVLSLRFGLDGVGPLGLGEIGGKLGVSKERVRQIEAQALGKLRCVAP